MQHTHVIRGLRLIGYLPYTERGHVLCAHIHGKSHSYMRSIHLLLSHTAIA